MFMAITDWLLLLHYDKTYLDTDQQEMGRDAGRLKSYSLKSLTSLMGCVSFRGEDRWVTKLESPFCPMIAKRMNITTVINNTRGLVLLSITHYSLIVLLSVERRGCEIPKLLARNHDCRSFGGTAAKDQ